MSSVSSPPVAGITAICEASENSNSRAMVKAIVRPSGDQAGKATGSGRSVSCDSPPSSTSTMKRLERPSRIETNTIRRPSGDQLGCWSTPGERVSCRASPPPAASITQMSRLPARSLTKAICFPSGDQAGSLSAAALCVSATAGPPEAGRTKRSGMPSRREMKAWRPSPARRTPSSSAMATPTSSPAISSRTRVRRETARRGGCLGMGLSRLLRRGAPGPARAAPVATAPRRRAGRRSG